MSLKKNDAGRSSIVWSVHGGFGDTARFSLRDIYKEAICQRVPVTRHFSGPQTHVDDRPRRFFLAG